MKRILRKYNRKHGIHHPLLALDFENNPDNGAFICCGVYGDIKHRTTRRVDGVPRTVYTNKRLSLYFTDIHQLYDFLLSLKANSCIIVTYNLSYDRVFLDMITAQDETLTIGTRVIMVKLKNGIKVMDLFNHTMTGSLADWIQYLNMTKKWGIAKAELHEYYDRVMNDAKATFRLGEFIENFYYNECGIPLQLTVGAAAMKLFTMKYFTDYWERESDFYSQYERYAYYGGRTEIFKRGEQVTYSYDVNSMYLSIMRDCEIPDVITGKYIDNKPPNWRKYLKKYLGIWHVKITCPDKVYLPLLPVRMDGKLKFPVGTFTGYWTSIELNKALEIGYKINQVYDFLYYRHSKKYFTELAKFVWTKRKEYKALNNRGMDLMIKRIGNSLYGKFAQRNSDNYFGRLADYKEDLPDVLEFIEYKGEIWIVIKGELRPSKHEFPAISAFITSYARLRLYQAMESNQDTLIYVDTDSVKLTSKAKGIDVGKELGQWGLESAGEVVIFHRPKLYGNKRKGVPKRAVPVCVISLKEYYVNNEIESWHFDKPLRYREAIRRGEIPNKWVSVIKNLNYTDDKRSWNGCDSVPIKYA